MRLESNHEIIGNLLTVEEEDNCYTLQFTCTKEIELPTAAIPLEKLISHIGKRIGVFNNDGSYKLRVIRSKTPHTKSDVEH